MHQKHSYLTTWLLFLVIVCGATSAIADETGFKGTVKPQIQVSPATGQVVVDGVIGEPAWRTAAKATDFVEGYPGDRTMPPVQTEAYLTYDDKRLYVAFVCHDDPSSVRASFCERDQISNDDNVRFCLDTYGEAAWAYVFYVNPFGVQGDAMWANTGGEAAGYDLIWESAGMVTDSGYQVEMAIPFASLRFPNTEDQVWRADFWRNHPREAAAEYSWAAYDRNENCWPCQWGTLRGIAGVAPGRGIEITPSVIGYQSGSLQGTGEVQSPYEFTNDNANGELSVWGKCSVSSNATVEATINPDFSQIEADAGQIDVNTTFTLFYPERRPFFQEGSDLFRAAVYTVNTRMINDPELAAKATLRFGRTSLGYILARDKQSPVILPSKERSDYLLAGKSTSNILRIRHTVGEGSEVGAILTDQRFDDGGSGSSLTHDGLFRLSPSVRARYHFTVSHVEEFDDADLTSQIPDPNVTFDGKYTRAFDGEKFWGYFGYGSFGWWTSTWNASLAYQECSPTFRQHNGFFRQNDYRNVLSVVGYYYRLPSGLFETINPHIRAHREWEIDGSEKYRTLELNLWTRLRAAQAGFYSQYVRTIENYGGVHYDRVWYIYQDAALQLGDLIQLTADAEFGHKIARRYGTMGEMFDFGLSAVLKLHERLSVQQWLDYACADELVSGAELYDGYIYRTRFNYQASRPLAVRLVVQYDDFQKQWSIDPLLTYRLNAFSVFYLGSTHNYGELEEERPDGRPIVSNHITRRQFFAKLQYLFQI